MTTCRKRFVAVAAAGLLAMGTVAFFCVVASSRMISDYASGAEGRVVDTAGRPIANATITIAFDRTVFEAITPRRRKQVSSDQLGRFEAVLISCGQPGGGYTVLVEKSGFLPVRVRGSGAGSHRIVLTPVSVASHM